MYVKTLNEEEHKRKLEEDAMMEIDRELVQEAIDHISRWSARHLWSVRIN